MKQLPAKTGNMMSSLAAKYLHLTDDELLSLTATPQLRYQTAEEIRSMAGSLLRQDEVKGWRRVFRWGRG